MRGVETLDDIAVGITYNKDPYTTNERFSVVTPDLPSQHKFFTVNNYTHWYLEKKRHFDYGDGEGKEREKKKKMVSMANTQQQKEGSGVNTRAGKKRSNLVRAGAACMGYNTARLPKKSFGPLTKKCFACSSSEEASPAPVVSYMKVKRMSDGTIVKLTNEGYSRTAYGGFYMQ
eukprot:TRINITY_DN6144_c0_g1_i3.p2 TRINITY_DN6144_c0_g1~~TRINITY_DN6144_c0_g1_i3.p2  ORF type:complete len:174 (+),score=36.33 TRINITY_DN6144_c0_g1_i3:156-677(+)